CVQIRNFVSNSTPRFLEWSNTSSKAEWNGKQSANSFVRRYSSSPRELTTQPKKRIRSGRSNSCAVAASDQSMGAAQTEIPHRPWYCVIGQHGLLGDDARTGSPHFPCWFHHFWTSTAHDGVRTVTQPSDTQAQRSRDPGQRWHAAAHQEIAFADGR